GHDVRDTRAVLAAATTSTDGSLSSPVGAHASPAALQAIATALATAAEGIDFTAAAQGLNPIYNNGGCTGAVIDITSISIGSIADLFNSHVRPGVENSLASMIKSKLPPLADTQLGKLIAKPYTVSVLGHDAYVSMVPSSVHIDSNGLFAGADSTLVVSGGEG